MEARVARQTRAYSGGGVRLRSAEGHRVLPGYLVSAGIMLLALVIAVVAIRVRREDLAGVNPMADPGN